MADCKNCEGAIAFINGLCQGCLEEAQQEMEWNGITCKTSCCDELVPDEGDYCAECKMAMAEDKYDAEREERLLNNA